MSKIICEICGTTYSESADSCPICGCSRDAAADFLKDDFLTEEFEDVMNLDMHIPAKKKKEIFDFDEVNAPVSEDPVEEDVPYEDEEEPEEEQERGHNVFVVILLTVLIVALLAAAGFVFVRYFLPNMKDN